MDETILFVTIEGGICQGVCSPTPEALKNVKVVLIDYDTDGAEPGDLTPVKQRGHRNPVPAFVADLPIEKAIVSL